MLDAIHQADALYVHAIASVSSDVAAKGSLGPVARACLEAGATALQKIGPGIIEQIGSAAAEQAVALLPPAIMQVASEVATVASSVVAGVADIIPMVGAVIQLVTSFEAGENAKAQAYYAAETAASMSVPVVGSGPNGQASLGDVFSFAANDPSPEKFPLSTLGRGIVGVTETDDDPDNNSSSDTVYDRPTYHAAIVYDGVARVWYRALVPSEPNVGIPLARRRVLKALRLGIAAHGTASRTLAPIWMDLFASCWNTSDWGKGQLTGGFAVYLLGHYFRSDTLYGRFGGTGWVEDIPIGANPMGDGSPGPYAGATGWSEQVNAMAKMVAAWQQVKLAPPARPIRLQFSGTDPRPMILSILKNPALSPAVRAYWEKKLADLPSAASAAVHAALAYGWTPALDASLPAAMTFVLLLERLRAAARPHLSAAALAKFHPHVNLFR